jgi:hypothetical protein
MKKAAAAATQNWAAIKAAKESGGLFGAVTKQLGNGGFEITLRKAGIKGQRTTVQATPRGLFGRGVMRIAVGHVVLLAGELSSSGIQRPLEIVGRLDSRAEIQELVDLGHLPAEVLGIAETAGAVETAARAEVATEELFDSEGSDEDFWVQGVADVKGGLKAERKAQETAATIAARVAGLKGARMAAASGTKRKGVDGGVEVGDMADIALVSDPDYERFKRWRAHKATARVMAGGGSVAMAMASPVMASPNVPVVNAEAVQTMAELMQQFKLEKEAAERAADQAAIVAAAEAAAKGAEAKAWLAKQPVKDNWDDEEVNIDDL